MSLVPVLLIEQNLLNYSGAINVPVYHYVNVFNSFKMYFRSIIFQVFFHVMQHNEVGNLIQ